DLAAIAARRAPAEGPHLAERDACATRARGKSRRKSGEATAHDRDVDLASRFEGIGRNRRLANARCPERVADAVGRRHHLSLPLSWQRPGVRRVRRDHTVLNVFCDLGPRALGGIAIAATSAKTKRDDIATLEIDGTLRAKRDHFVAAPDFAEAGRAAKAAEQP